MKTVTFNIHGASISHAGESVALRIGYLLSDYVAAMGTSGLEIHFESWFNPHGLEQKAKWVESFYARRGEQSGIEAEKVRETVRAMRKIKHMDKQGIVMLKKFEKALDVLFKIAKAEALDEKQATGLPQLDPLCDGKVMGGYYIELETPEKGAKDQHAASKLLSLQLPDPEEGLSLFILTHEFLLLQETKQRKWFSASDRESALPGNIYLERCFGFPNINILNAIELKTVRQQFEHLAIPFRKAVDGWMELCYNGTDFEQRKKHFREQVLTTAAGVNHIILQNEVLQRYMSLLDKGVVTYVWMGEVPVELIWEFYREGKTVTDETWEALMKIKEERNWQGQRWPVMAMELPEAKAVMDATREEQEQVKAVKKSISVD